MFDHVAIRASDLAASRRFYEVVLAAIGLEPRSAADTFIAWHEFIVLQESPDRPAARGLHIGFAAASRELVDAFWRAGVDAGYRDDGAPGPRPVYGGDYYGGFLLDPDGNSAEAVHHEGVRRDGAIDHLWIRVADVPAARRFYLAIAPYAGFRLKSDEARRAQFAGGLEASFSVVAGRPTEHLHMAFPATSDVTVRGFFEAALEAGARENGGPGERSQYHAGYYSAFALDPDGNNIEVVNHNR